MTILNIIWCSCTNKCIPYRGIYLSQLTLFPIARKTFEANGRDFFSFCREHVLQVVFFQRLQLA